LTLGEKKALYLPDSSYIWYRGGFREPMDGPALLEKFDAYLLKLMSETDGSRRLQQVVDTLADEHGLAVFWGSLLVAGTEHPEQLAMTIAPLAAAVPILSGDDTRHQAGQFIEAAYSHLHVSHREKIERAILSIADERVKKILVQCVPEALIATDELRQHQKVLRAAGEAQANIPPYQIKSSTRAFDTEAYLREQGVKTDDPVSQAIRAAMKCVEQLAPNVQGPQITLDIAKERLKAINGLRVALEGNAQVSAGTVLYEHACGTLASAAAHTTTALEEVIGDAEVRRDLTAALLLCANSTNPHFDAAIEAKFHEMASWGGPSARTSAAQGLICLVRFDTAPDAPVLEVIHRLAHDSVCHVRFQIAAELHFVHRVDQEWMWTEYQHALLKEPTRTVVNAALCSLGQAAPLDLPRVVRLCKAVLSRYENQTGPGIDTCRTSAASLIVDLYMWGNTAGTSEFFLAQLNAFPENSSVLTQWVARYSGNLLIGSAADANDKKNRARVKSLQFYSSLLDLSYSEAERIWTRNGLDRAATWPAPELERLQAMFRVIDEITMRIYFAAGAQNASAFIPDTPERRRFYREIRPLLAKLADVMVVHVAHHVIQTLESFIGIDPAGVFELIARSVRASEKGGYTMESMAADVIVRVVERYLADHRDVFADPKRLSDLIDCLDAFVRAGWPAAQALTFRLGEIWR
jgi:hypothetical protein